MIKLQTNRLLKGVKLKCLNDIIKQNSIFFIKDNIYEVLYINNEDIFVKACLKTELNKCIEFNIDWVTKNFKII